ncbi:hypothetical protein CU098_008153, partial [Rhizopus stolonifer]
MQKNAYVLPDEAPKEARNNALLKEKQYLRVSMRQDGCSLPKSKNHRRTMTYRKPIEKLEPKCLEETIKSGRSS